MALKMRVRQQKLFTDTDSELVKACDAFDEANTELINAKTRLDAAAVTLIAAMRKVNQPRVRHAGKVFELSEVAAKTKIKVKEIGGGA